MTISDENLKILYRKYLEETAASSRESCPDPESILKLMRSPQHSRRTRKTLDHISRCFHCAQEFDFILNTLRQESVLNKRIRQSVSETGSNNSFSPPSRRFRKLIPVVVVFLLIVISAGYYILRNFQGKEYRSISKSSIKIEQPGKKPVELDKLVFGWSKIKGIVYYKIEVFNETLSPIWESTELYSNSIKAPSELRKILTGNETYFWMVSAVFLDGKIHESRLERFTIKR